MKKIINRLKNIKPRTKKIIIILLVIFMLLSIAFKWYFGSLNPYISELNIVYTPTKPAYRFYRWYWIDIYDYSIFRLTNKEEQNIIQEAESGGNWTKMTDDHIEKLDCMDYGDILGYSYKNHDCYICIYDDQNSEIITDSENLIYHDTTEWIIFLYDTNTNKYYCIFQTM